MRKRPTISHFWCVKARVHIKKRKKKEEKGRREEEKKKKKEERRKEEEKKRYGIYICLDYVWIISMEKVYGMVWN